MNRRLFAKFLSNSKIRFFTYGVITNTAFSVCLRCAADFLQQNIENKSLIQQKEDYNFNRTKNVATVGIISGPLMYAWYNYLDYKLPGTKFKTIATKILWDQTVGTFVFTFIFIVGICLLENQSIKLAINEFKQKFPFIYLVFAFVFLFH